MPTPPIVVHVEFFQAEGEMETQSFPTLMFKLDFREKITVFLNTDDIDIQFVGRWDTMSSLIYGVKWANIEGWN